MDKKMDRQIDMQRIQMHDTIDLSDARRIKEYRNIIWDKTNSNVILLILVKMIA